MKRAVYSGDVLTSPPHRLITEAVSERFDKAGISQGSSALTFIPQSETIGRNAVSGDIVEFPHIAT